MAAKRERMLSAEEERALFGRYIDDGDETARDELLLAYKPLAVRSATGFAKKGNLPLEDLCQEAFIALAQAIAKFDRNKEARLSTFAAYYIRAALMRFVMDHTGIVRVGTNLADKKIFSNLRRMVSEIEARTGNVITDDGRREIAERLGTSLKAIQRMEARVYQMDASTNDMDASSGEGRSENSRAVPHPKALIVDSHEGEISAEKDRSTVVSRAWDIVRSNFDGRDLEIVTERLKGEMTPDRYKLLVEKHGITVERIRQIQRGGLAVIRDGLSVDGITGMHAISA
jgi:RNA polymerase sigma-32 factor